MKRLYRIFLTICISHSVFSFQSQGLSSHPGNSPQKDGGGQKFRVWINSDLNTDFDPDDKVALAQMWLIADHFDIRGMVFLDAAWAG